MSNQPLKLQEVFREKQFWGTFGKHPISYDMKYVQWVLVKCLSNSHVHAILETQDHIPDWFRRGLVYELLYRKLNGIHIPDTDNYNVS